MAAICNKTKLNSHMENDKFIPTYPEVTTAAFIITELLKSPKLMDFNYVCAIIADTIGINILLKILFKLHKTATVDEMIKYNAIVQIVLDTIVPLHLKKESTSVLTFKSNSDTFLKIETKILNAYDLLPKAVKKPLLARRKCPRIKIDLERDWGIKVEYNNVPVKPIPIPMPQSHSIPLNDSNANIQSKLKTKLNIVTDITYANNNSTDPKDDHFFISSRGSSPQSTVVDLSKSPHNVLISPTKKKQRVTFLNLDSSPKSKINKNKNSFGTLMSGSKYTHESKQTVKSNIHHTSAELVSAKPIVAQAVKSIEITEPIEPTKPFDPFDPFEPFEQTEQTEQTKQTEPIELINPIYPSDTTYQLNPTESTSTDEVQNKQPKHRFSLSGWSRVKLLLKNKNKSSFF